MLASFRPALRGLIRAKRFSAVTILTLALGIGSATAIFSVVDWVLFRSTDYPDGLCLIGRQMSGGQFLPTLPGIVADDYDTRRDLFETTGRGAAIIGNVAFEGEPVATLQFGATRHLLEILKIKPTLGRDFLPAEYTSGQDNVAIITYDFWQTKLGGRADVLDLILQDADSSCTIIGVLGKNQTMPSQMSAGIVRPHHPVTDPANPWSPPYTYFAKLRPDQTPESVQAALTANPVSLPPNLAYIQQQASPAVNSLQSANAWLRPEYYRVMFGAVGFLYALSCLNVINLIALRHLDRAKEFGIRLSLGASRWQLFRLSLVENICLILGGSLLGLIVANVMLPIVLSLSGSSQFGADTGLWRLDPRAVMILVGLAITTGAIITLPPSVRLWRIRSSPTLKTTGGTLGDSRFTARLRSGLVVLQIVVALVLLAGAGLMVRSFERLQSVEPGFTVEDRWSVTPYFADKTITRNLEKLGATWSATKAALQELPGVIRVSYGSNFIMSGYAMANQAIENDDGSPSPVAITFLDDDYLATAGLQILRGRSWQKGNATNEVLINESLARLRWPDTNPIGQLIRPARMFRSHDSDQVGLQVVGVIRDPVASPRLGAPPAIYRSISNGPYAAQSIIIQTAPEVSEAFGEEVRRHLYNLNPSLVIFGVTPFTEIRARQLMVETLARSVLQILAAIALVLTAVGIFSLLAFTVNQRCGEFGVRLALGATRRHVLHLVLNQGLKLTLLGILIGLGCAWGLGRFLTSLVYETSAHDPVVLAVVGSVLLLIALSACLVPAIRATRIDIARLLHSE